MNASKNVALNLGGARERTESNVQNRFNCNVLDTLVEQQEHERKIFFSSHNYVHACVCVHLGFVCGKAEGDLLTLYARISFRLFHKIQGKYCE